MSATNRGTDPIGSIPIAPARRLSQVQPRSVEFIWRPYLVRRKSNILDGDPGVGKTALAIAIMSVVTCGLWSGRPEPVLFLTAEDDAEDTIRPRFEANGANLDLVNVVDAYNLTEGELWKTLEHHLPILQPAIVALDPISAFIGEKA